MTPKVSIVVPVYKVEPYVERCARSLFGQSWPEIEYVFVDDGTPDNSIGIIQTVLEEYPHRRDSVKIIHQPNGGLARARVSGMAHVTGDYVIHVDSDDWVEPDYIESMLSAALEQDADVVICDYVKELADRSIVRPVSYDGGNGLELVYEINHSARVEAFMWNKLLRSSLWRKGVKYVPARPMHEDICFLTQIAWDARKVVHIGKALYHYRFMRAGAITASSKKQNRKESSVNMINLYESQKSEPYIEVCKTDMLMRAVWNCLKINDMEVVREHREIVEFIAGVPYGRRYRSALPKQFIMKVWARCALLKGKK